MKKLSYGLPLIGVFALGLTVGVVAVAPSASPITTPLATGSLPSSVHAVISEPVAARTLARVRVTDLTIVKIVNKPTPVLRP